LQAPSRRLVAEALATALLVATVVGSGIMAERLAGGQGAIALLANTVATGAILVALLLTFGPISGAHLNPVVTLGEVWLGRLAPREGAGYVAAQVLGALAGVLLADGMFGLPLLDASHHARAGFAPVVSEAVATFGLLAVIHGCGRFRPGALPAAVPAYIVAAYWFTPSTSFANPAVTIARALTDSFAGIRPVDVPGFVGGQLVGGLAAVALFRWLHAGSDGTA